MRGHPGLPGLRLVLALSVAVCVLLLATGPAAAATLTPCNVRERALLDAMNSAREKEGLPALHLGRRLTKAANRHANSMARNGYASHDLYTPSLDDEWTPINTWLRWYWPGPGYTSWATGENIAWGAPDLTKKQAMSFWMNSAPHRANILGHFNRVGISAVRVEDPDGDFGQYSDVTIWSVDFGRRSDG